MIKKHTLHIFFWLFMLFFIFDYHWFEISWQEAMGYAAWEVFGYMIIFYLNLKIIKSFFERYHYFTLCFSIGFILAYALVITQLGLDVYFYDKTGYRTLFSIVLNASLFIGLAWLFYFTERNRMIQEKNLALEATNNQLQIDILKSKINPHFLFNTLNNLNALIIQQDENVPTFIGKLSAVLRYGLDVGQQRKVKLTDEITYLEHYLTLVKLQKPASNNIDFYIEGAIEEVYILPFILVTLLENAIKYGDFQHNETGFLHIHLSVSDNFYFEMTNSTASLKKGGNGIGLDNIQKQLRLYYGNDYSLQQKKKENIFTVTLQMPIGAGDRNQQKNKCAFLK